MVAPAQPRGLAFLLSPELTPGRACGPCMACCTCMRIGELEKPIDTHCPNEQAVGGGCSIYAQRPQSCAAFECLWLQGLVTGDDRRRPDQLGLIFTFGASAAGQTRPLIMVWEAWSQAADTGPARHLLMRLEQRVMFVLKRWGKPEHSRYALHGPGGQVEKYRITGTATGFRLETLNQG